MTYFIGIDPGLSGAAVVIHPDSPASTLVYTDCPARLAVRQQGLTNPIDRHDPAGMLRFLLPYRGNAVAVLETVRIDNRDHGHLISAEVLIRTHEAWRTVLEALDIQVHHLYPVQWRKPLGLSGSDGDIYCEAALKLYPQCQPWVYYKSKNGRWKLNHNRAEAALMAHVAMLKASEVAA